MAPLLVIVCLLFPSLPAQAASRWWDGGTTDIAGNGDGASTGGDGNWNQTTKNWDRGSSYSHVAWDNNHSPEFGGAAGTVTVTANITARFWQMTFSTAGYTIAANGGYGILLSDSNPSQIHVNQDATISAPLLGGTGPLVVDTSGSGVLTLSGNNTFANGLTISGATLAVGTINLASAPGPLGQGTVTLGTPTSSGTLRYIGSSSSTARVLTMPPNRTGTIQVDGTANLSLDGVIPATTGNLKKTGTGTLTLGANNLYTGKTLISGGTLQIDAEARLGPTAASDALSLGTGGTLKTTASFSIDDTSRGLTILSGTGGGAFAPDGGTTLTVANVIASIDATGGLIMNGAGTLTLTAANTYTCPTTVNAGTLLVKSPGSLAAGSAVSVGTGATPATLGGDGTIYGTVTVGPNGTLAPGASIGTLKLGAKPTLNGTLTMELKPSDQTCDKLNLTSGGALTYGGTLALQVVAGEMLAGGEVFDLFDFTGTADGSFAITTAPPLASDLNWWEGLLASEGKLMLNRAPTGVMDHNLSRAKGVSMKISKSDLMAGVSDPDNGDSASFDQVLYDGSATVTEDEACVYYLPANDSADTVPFRVKDTRGGTVTRNVNITVVPSYGVVEIQHNGGGSVTLSFFGIPDYRYFIQRSCGDNLQFSDLVGPITTPANGLIQHTDTPGEGCDPAFYRTRSE